MPCSCMMQDLTKKKPPPPTKFLPGLQSLILTPSSVYKSLTQPTLVRLKTNLIAKTLGLASNRLNLFLTPEARSPGLVIVYALWLIGNGLFQPEFVFFFSFGCRY